MECLRCRIGPRDSRTLLRAVRNIEHLIEADLVFADHVESSHQEIEASVAPVKAAHPMSPIIALNLALIIIC